ncbi:MAG TPA: DUF4388 domain-containing protein [Candidatus Dormibacteraeota bacterium]
MNIWFAVAAVVGLVLIAVVLIKTQRPRHAEDELAQPTRRPSRVDTPGAIDPAGVRDLLRSMQAERRTGTLQLTAGGRTCSLYFLFGHLFHAASDTQTGEPALLDCVAWQDVHYTFDKSAQLPTQESIERPMDEILA